MHKRFWFLNVPLLGLCLMAAVAALACTTTPPDEPDAEPTASSADATDGADASGAGQVIPIEEFLEGHTVIAADWDQFHADFDEWSAGLSACHPNSMREALNDFAVSFNSVTEQARGLTRGTTSGQLADLVIVAAENEETALRQLRDRWQPNNVSLFENVELHRAQASQAQKSAEDMAIELREGFEDAADPEATAEFLEAFEPIRDDWNQLHDDYETLRDESEELGATAVNSGIAAHVEGLRSIIDRLEDLPDLEGSEETIEELLAAAQAEVEAFEGGTAAAESSSTEASESAESAAESSTDSAATNGTTGSASTGSANGNGGAGQPDFDALDEVVDANGKTLKEANRTVQDLADPDAEKSLAELAVFGNEYARLVNDWDSFHDRYNSWRKTDGGCDRAQVIEELEQHSLSISALAREVRTLPSSGSLLPIYSLLTEAASRDENAIRTLRYTWQPFALDAFKAVHQERIDTERLRRHAEIAVQELQNRS